MWSENKIKSRLDYLKTIVKENERFIADNSGKSKFIYVFSAECKKQDNRKMNIEISVLEKVLN